MTPQELKASILQLAIQGKLVEQRAEEETAEALIRSINPKDITRSVSSIEDTECPYDIPENWRWVRLGSVLMIERGGSPRPIKEYLTDAENGINWIKIGDTDKGGKYINGTQEKIIPEGMKKSRYVRKGDFLLSNSMSFGRPYILNIDGCIHDGWLVLRPIAEVFDKDYLYYLLSSPMVFQQFCSRVAGAVVNNLNSDKVAITVVPLPPLAEQKRIVAKIEELLPYIDRYEQAWSRLEDFNRRFPVDMQKSILQTAIQGKLVEQRPAEGTGEELYQQIQQEKQRLIRAGIIKKEKPLPEITEDEIPFDIPEGWKWVRWGNVVNVVSARRVHQSDWKTQGVPFYRAREIAKLAERGHVDNELFISEELFDEFAKSGVPHEGDLMVTAVGTLGKTYIVKADDKFYYKDASVICLENFAHLSPEYLRFVMHSEMLMNQVRSNSSGTTVATLTIVRMNEYVIPLPPLAEQKRIVAKLEELLPLCERLK